MIFRIFQANPRHIPVQISTPRIPVDLPIDEATRMNSKKIGAVLIAFAALAAFGAAAQPQQGSAGQGIKQDAKAVGHGVADGARDVGHATKHVARKIGHGAKEAGTGIGHGAKKAGIAIGHGAREGWEATKRGVKQVFNDGH
jgi:hypothetical protein